MTTPAPLATGTRKAAPLTTCHCASATGGAGEGAPVVALIGAPNSGKSTLFNALTGSRITVGNWPGTTVEVSRGAWQQRTLLDLPGAYSLDALSPDEELTRDLLLADDRPDVVIVLVDAANLARSLYLVSQVREHRQRVVVALTMLDVATRRGIEVDPVALSDALGCPVVALDPRRRSGLRGLEVAVAHALRDDPPKRRVHDCCADELVKADERFVWVAAAVEAAADHSGAEQLTWSDRIDRVATAPVLGPLLFLGVMWLVFQVTTTVAAPLQDFFDSLFSGPVTDGALAGFAALGLSGTWIEGLVVDGLIADALRQVVATAVEDARRAPGTGPAEQHDLERLVEVVGNALAVAFRGGAEQPHQQEERHHRGDEVRVRDLPSAPVRAMPALLDALDDDRLQRLAGGGHGAWVAQSTRRRRRRHFFFTWASSSLKVGRWSENSTLRPNSIAVIGA